MIYVELDSRLPFDGTQGKRGNDAGVKKQDRFPV
ncbi:hypothetical protein CANDROIZ_340019 [Candidatus Roizmanbacteria bacterium]|nr:hypothetical protein CANDROIZ_340019 [Candidatus Roizmanbacteria bacterium]